MLLKYGGERDGLREKKEEEKREVASTVALFYRMGGGQRGLKDTECKLLGHLFLGVTHTRMSSTVQTLTPSESTDRNYGTRCVQLLLTLPILSVS